MKLSLLIGALKRSNIAEKTFNERSNNHPFRVDIFSCVFIFYVTNRGRLNVLVTMVTTKTNPAKNLTLARTKMDRMDTAQRKKQKKRLEYATKVFYTSTALRHSTLSPSIHSLKPSTIKAHSCPALISLTDLRSRCKLFTFPSPTFLLCRRIRT